MRIFFCGSLCFCFMTAFWVGCTKSDDDKGIPEDEISNYSAPATLTPGYAFVRYKDSDSKTLKEVVLIKVNGGLQHSNSFIQDAKMIPTTYTYQKTSDSTANFSYSIQQIINGPTVNRYWTRTGVLKFRGNKQCLFEFRERYYADGVLGMDQNSKLDYYFVPQSEAGLQWSIY